MGDIHNYHTGPRISVPDLLITHANRTTSFTNEYIGKSAVHYKTHSRSPLNEKRKELQFWTMSKEGQSNDNCNEMDWWDASDKTQQKSLPQFSDLTEQPFLGQEIANIGESKSSFRTATNQSNTTVGVLTDDTLISSHTQFKDDSSQSNFLRSLSAPDVTIDRILVHKQLQDLHDSDNEWSDISDNEMGQIENKENKPYIKNQFVSMSSKNDDQIKSNDGVRVNCQKTVGKTLPTAKTVKLWQIQKRYVKITFKKNGNAREKIKKRSSTRATIVAIHTQPSCLHCYLSFMYYICVSTKPYFKNMSAAEKFTQTLQKVILFKTLNLTY